MYSLLSARQYCDDYAIVFVSIYLYFLFNYTIDLYDLYRYYLHYKKDKLYYVNILEFVSDQVLFTIQILVD